MKRIVLGGMIALAVVALAGVGLAMTRPDLVPAWARMAPAPKAAADSGLYCKEHGVPEKFCTLCHAELKASLLLCKEHGDIPEDIPTAEIDDGDPEIGHFSPWSWWPMILAFGLAMMFLGLAVGVWIAFIGAPIVLIAIVGWQYEYYRNFFAR